MDVDTNFIAQARDRLPLMDARKGLFFEFGPFPEVWRLVSPGTSFHFPSHSSVIGRTQCIVNNLLLCKRELLKVNKNRSEHFETARNAHCARFERDTLSGPHSYITVGLMFRLQSSPVSPGLQVSRPGHLPGSGGCTDKRTLHRLRAIRKLGWGESISYALV